MMNPITFSPSIMSSVSGINQAGIGINLLWQAICNYVDTNAMVTCMWSGSSTSVPPVPEVIPTVLAKVVTAAGRDLSPYLVGIDSVSTCAEALGKLSLAMNTAILQWKLILPTELLFITMAPGTVVSPSTIVLTPSMATDSTTAFNLLGSQIIAGLSTVMFTPIAGSHSGIFFGAATQTIPGIH